MMKINLSKKTNILRLVFFSSSFFHNPVLSPVFAFAFLTVRRTFRVQVIFHLISQQTVVDGKQIVI